MRFIPDDEHNEPGVEFRWAILKTSTGLTAARASEAPWAPLLPRRVGRDGQRHAAFLRRGFGGDRVT